MTLNWQMRAILPELREEGRLNVLIALLLHVNTRNRAYPGMDLLASETGFGLQAVTAAKRWLIERGAIVLVPHKLRVEDERKLPSRQHVYQLTGVILIAIEVMPTMAQAVLVRPPVRRRGNVQTVTSASGVVSRNPNSASSGLSSCREPGLFANSYGTFNTDRFSSRYMVLGIAPIGASFLGNSLEFLIFWLLPSRGNHHARPLIFNHKFMFLRDNTQKLYCQVFTMCNTMTLLKI